MRVRYLEPSVGDVNLYSETVSRSVGDSGIKIPPTFKSRLSEDGLQLGKQTSSGRQATDERPGNRSKITMLETITTISGLIGWGKKERSEGPVDELAPKHYTLAEVSEHCDPNDCWIVVGYKVYDVSDFLKEHPGGHDIILEQAGRDATIPFYGTGHTKEAFCQLEKYCVGLLVEHQRFKLFDDERLEPLPGR